jgi:uncharacterized protein (DUF924 family)
MEYYTIAYNLEKENNENARYYYELAVLFEYNLALKHMEYLDKPNFISYLKKYNNSQTNSDFLEILSFWYNNMKIYKNTKALNVEMSSNELDELWTQIWFAKGETQTKVDNELKKFEYYYKKYKDYKPYYLYEYIALIILYDQIPRNIFRNSAKAYDTDNIAFNHAKYLIKFMEYIPYHLSIPIIMSYIHSESIEILNQTKDIIGNIQKKYYNNYNNIFSSLNGIFQNHYDRISLFGRIPERNKFLNRESTENELVYLQSI